MRLFSCKSPYFVYNPINVPDVGTKSMQQRSGDATMHMQGPYDKAFALNIQVCPFCQQRCDIEAIVCPHCTHTIPEEYRIINLVPNYYNRVLAPLAWFAYGLFVVATCCVMAYFDYFPNGTIFLLYFVSPLVGFIAECFHSILGVRRRFIFVPLISMIISYNFITENQDVVRWIGVIVWFLLWIIPLQTEPEPNLPTATTP